MVEVLVLVSIEVKVLVLLSVEIEVLVLVCVEVEILVVVSVEIEVLSNGSLWFGFGSLGWLWKIVVRSHKSINNKRSTTAGTRYCKQHGSITGAAGTTTACSSGTR